MLAEEAMCVPPVWFAPMSVVPVGSLLAERIAMGQLELPVLPEVAAQVSSLVSSPDCSATALTDAIRRDAAVSANLLRVANSAALGGRTRVTTLQQAISRLGFAQVRQISVAVACRSRIFCVPAYDEEVREAFRHSFGTAWYAQRIARLRRASMDDAFMLGLLHDIGVPVLYQAVSDIERELGVTCDRLAVARAIHEQHEEVAEGLWAKWNLAPSLGDIIAHHHRNSVVESSCGMGAILQLADVLAELAMDDDDVHEQAARSHPAIAALNLYATDVDALLDERQAVAAMVGSVA